MTAHIYLSLQIITLSNIYVYKCLDNILNPSTNLDNLDFTEVIACFIKTFFFNINFLFRVM